VNKGLTYEIVLTITEPWEGRLQVHGDRSAQGKGHRNRTRGFGYDKMTPAMYFGLPLRRQIASNWFATVLRATTRVRRSHAGFQARGVPSINCPAPPPRYKATFKAPRDGEVSFYVNDSVIGFPGTFDMFYRPDKWTRMTNKGKPT